MASQNLQRRDFLKTSAVAAGAASVPFWFPVQPANAWNQNSPNERPVLGCIGTGSRWGAVGPNAMEFADCVAVADVDSAHAESGAKRVKDIQGKKGRNTDVEIHEDYQRILDNDKIDVVTIVTPDHWHSKIAIEAMKAGKDVYCEKPLTLTIDEGKKIRRVLEETNRVFQVGTQQRSEMGLRFLQAVAMLRDKRIGDIKKVTCAIGGVGDSGPIPKADPPSTLNWEKWLGQAPLVDFRYKKGGRWGKSRCHYEFRWWYEYSGGKMTDWGAHHVDIAMWGLGMDDSGPTEVEPVSAHHAVDLKDGMPVQDDRYNVALKFHVIERFADGVEMHIRDRADDLGFDNGIMFEGTDGRFLVNRGKIVGAPVDDLKKNPLPEGLMREVYKGREPGGNNAHMKNFFDCTRDREQPVSDVHSHHRAMTACHLANIAVRLGRSIKWDPEAEMIVGDEQAQSMQAREQRKGYEIEV